MNTADDGRMKRVPTSLELLYRLCGDDNDERALIEVDMDEFRAHRQEDSRPAALNALRYAVVKYGIAQTGRGLMKRIYEIGKMAGLM